MSSTAAHSAPPAANPAPPDWATVQREILCPLCDYSLRGLSEPRCPECGHRFEWAEVLSPQAQLHPYLFEHHPRHGAWSFVRTQLGGLLPRRFWRTLNPSQPSRPNRLVLYWLIAAALLVAAQVVPFASHVHSVWAEANAARNRARMMWNRLPDDHEDKKRLIAQYGSWEKAIAAITPAQPLDRKMVSLAWSQYRQGSGVAIASAMAIAWPWMSFVALLLFAASMQRAQVKPIHVLRCAIYACDVGLILLCLWLLAPKDLLIHRDLRLAYSPTAIYIGLAAIALAAISWYRLGTAYHRYMRFDRPYATALAAQAIVLLLVLATLAVASDRRWL